MMCVYNRKANIILLPKSQAITITITGKSVYHILQLHITIKIFLKFVSGKLLVYLEQVCQGQQVDIDGCLLEKL